MGNKFYGEGNLGIDPVLNRRDSQDDDDAVCNLRIYFDKPVPLKDGGFEDKGGFWMNVEIWGKRAIRCHDLFKKGSRVTVDGSIMGKQWTDKESGEEQFGLVVRAKRVSPELMTVDAIQQKS